MEDTCRDTHRFLLSHPSVAAIPVESQRLALGEPAAQLGHIRTQDRGQSNHRPPENSHHPRTKRAAMKTTPLWKFYCDENDSPGLWRLWFKAQCVAVSYSPAWAKRGGRARWKRTKKVVSKIQPGHRVIAALPGRRVGRI